ncbi:platelet glycoprotein V-like [Pollicipes pollicipes]|uniref:platelet glycoprotein V-like n=1 Tax=Pollicipes pollicipes TaxID=41117 RepID=UPI001884CF9E|nr:platelet glycoprotein V-like [Pollicipes pollicipes]
MPGMQKPLAAVIGALLVAGAHSGIYESLFGSSALLCLDASPLGVTCDCPEEASRLYQGVDCSGLEVTDLPVGLTLPASAPTVSFERNQLTVVKEGQFQQNPSVKTARLSKNRIEVLAPRAFSGLPALETLLLDKNLLREIDPSALQGLKHLVRLDLGFNKLSTLDPELFAGTAIRELSLHYNPLVTLDAGLFIFLPHLQVLDLDSTDLSALPAGLLAVNQRLVTLLLPHNHLTAVPAETLSEATSLRTLDMSGNKLESVPSAGLAVVPSLRRLILSSMSSLRRLEANAFSGLDELEELLCQFNGLTEVDESAFKDTLSGEYLARLVRVDLKENSLTRISRDLLPWERMDYVDLERNPWTCDCEMDWVAKGNFLFEEEPLFQCKLPEAVAGRPVTSLKAEEFECENKGGSIALTVFLVLLALAIVAALVFVAWKFNICQKVREKVSSRPNYTNVRTNKERVEVGGLEWDNKDIGV